MKPDPAQSVRCAIYTRKSSEEGLEQDFNSLDAQREACSAYIRSQASEGWSESAARYDDGGISGGTLVRPGLQRLLADIAAGTVQIVVVYKVDRLTRSLLDFAKLVERFDSAGISFVSVTQSFNTTTSMGRLTLNMLLSFAQFEREVTAERIRDKIAASKAKGMWMGGTPPLGYKPNGRTLAIDVDHAALIRLIHARYRELGTVRALKAWLDAEQILTPVRQTGTGKTFGGALFSRGQLYSILRNPVYVGLIVHRGDTYLGLHPPLLERAEWDSVQAQLTAQVQGTHRAHNPRNALLAGKLFDADGQRMIAVHTTKNGQRFQYYVSEKKHYEGAEFGARIPAEVIEQLVIKHLADCCADGLAMANAVSPMCSQDNWRRLNERGHSLARKIRSGGHDVITPLLARVTVADQSITMTIHAAAIADELGHSFLPSYPAFVELKIAASLRRSGLGLQLISANGVAPFGAPKGSLIRLIVQSKRYMEMLRNTGIKIGELAIRERVTSSYVTRVLRLAFLAPELVEAIIDGRQPADLTSMRLLKLSEEGLWERQLVMSNWGTS